VVAQLHHLSLLFKQKQDAEVFEMRPWLSMITKNIALVRNS